MIDDNDRERATRFLDWVGVHGGADRLASEFAAVRTEGARSAISYVRHLAARACDHDPSCLDAGDPLPEGERCKTCWLIEAIETP